MSGDCRARGVKRRFTEFYRIAAQLRAFAGDPDINNLPRQHGPWVITGAIAPGATPPHNFSREAIEKAITASGFQLWRLSGG